MIPPEGMVGMKYFQPITQCISIKGTPYNFVPNRNVSFSWVKEEHVQDVLNITKQCCGGAPKPTFRLASPSDINIWHNLSER